MRKLSKFVTRIPFCFTIILHIYLESTLFTIWFNYELFFFSLKSFISTSFLYKQSFSSKIFYIIKYLNMQYARIKQSIKNKISEIFYQNNK